MKRLGTKLGAAGYVTELQRVLGEIDFSAVENLAALLHQAWRKERTVFVFGNGGSAATASHFAEDLGKGTVMRDDRSAPPIKRFKAMSLADNSPWITALANDLGYEHIFAEQLRNLARPGDIAVAISGSGNSANVVRSVQWANNQGMTTVGLTGFDGGRLKSIQQQGPHAPVYDMALAESVHLALPRGVVDDLFARVNQRGKYAREREKVCLK